jgi:hypothetical protein
MSILKNLLILLESGTKFVIPAGIKKNVKIDGGLANAENWKAKIILGNSIGKDKKKGDWDGARYIAIDLKSNTIIPIAMGDEHQTGSELIWHYKNKNMIPQGDYRYVDSWGNNYVYKNNDKGMVAAFKKFKEYGGSGDLKVKAMGNKYSGTINDYIERDGNIEIGKNELSAHGKKLISNLEYIAKEYVRLDKLGKAGRDIREADLVDFFTYIKYFLNGFIGYNNINDELHVTYTNELKSILNDDIVEKMIKKVEAAEVKLDYVSATQEIFSMNGIKNRIHEALKKVAKEKDSSSYSIRSYFESFFGDLDTAIKEFDRVGQI